MNNQLYVVILYTDELPKHEYGVNDNHYLIGIFDDKDIAEAVKYNTEMKIEKEGVFDSAEVEVKEVIANKLYDNGEFYIGGGFYIE